jgi:hypothetical protein
MREMPTIASSTYQTAALNVGALVSDSTAGFGIHDLNSVRWMDVPSEPNSSYRAHTPFVLQQEIPTMPARRLVQVFIADPNENIPLDQSLLYSGEQKLTDATDQELFFEVDIKGILEKHNAERIKLVDKKVKDRTEYLEPAKIRDLKMVVVTVAGF